MSIQLNSSQMEAESRNSYGLLKTKFMEILFMLNYIIPYRIHL